MRYCDEYICLSVCLSVCLCRLPYLRNQTAELLISMHVAYGSGFDGVAISYVLPVLWMTSCVHMGLMGAVATIPPRPTAIIED